jgi:hypothetical protein
MNASQVPAATPNRLALGAQLPLFALLPIPASNLYSILGVMIWNWSVADLFFWFWCEFVLAGITTFVLLLLWPTTNNRVPKSLAGWTFGFAFFYILFFVTLFAAVAYKGEWGSWSRFPQFLAQKRIGLAFLIVSFAILFGTTLTKRGAGIRALENVALLFNRRCFVILGFYILFLIHGWIREWTTGARSLSLSSSYLKAMGVALLFLKMLAEAGLFDRFFKRRANRI